MNVLSFPIPRAVAGLAAAALLVMAGSLNAGDIPADWERVAADTVFSLSAPAGTTYTPGQGIDSMIGSFDAASFQLNFDYGAYSDPLTHLHDNDGYQTREVEVDGRTAIIVSAYAPAYSDQQPYVIGIHFPNLGQSVVGTQRLTVYTMLETPDDFAMIEQIYGTIQFY